MLHHPPTTSTWGFMKETLIMMVAFVATMFGIGYLNANDVSACEARGHSYETCNRTFNR